MIEPIARRATLALVVLTLGCGADPAARARAAVRPGQDAAQVVDAVQASNAAGPMAVTCWQGDRSLFQALAMRGSYELQGGGAEPGAVERFAAQDGWLSRVKALAAERKCDALEVRAASARSFSALLGEDGRVREVTGILID